MPEWQLIDYISYIYIYIKNIYLLKNSIFMKYIFRFALLTNFTENREGVTNLDIK